MALSLKDFVFQTGTVTTDSNSEVTIALSCFLPGEIPCIVVSTYDVTGNANANVTDLTLTGTAWTAKIITSAPNTVVQYKAISATSGDANAPSLMTQNLFDIITQNNQQIQIQTS